MYRRAHRGFDLEATRAKEAAGYVVRISRKGTIVKTLGEGDKGHTFEDHNSALDAAIQWIDRSLLKARPKFKGSVS